VAVAHPKFLSDAERQGIAGRLEARRATSSLFQGRARRDGQHRLGQLRNELGRRLGSSMPPFSTPVEDGLPLLEWSPEDKRWMALHHPFTAPAPAMRNC
jgi:aspartyl-tRNA synthetase